MPASMINNTMLWSTKSTLMTNTYLQRLLLFLCSCWPGTIAFGPSRYYRELPALSIVVTMATPQNVADEQDSSSAMTNRLLAGVAKMNTVMTPEFFNASSSLQTFYSKLIKNIEIKESSIPGAGLGLFAKKAMKANSVVSFYPAHALGIDGLSFVSIGDTDQSYFLNHPSAKSSYLHCTDQPLFDRPSLLRRTTNDDNNNNNNNNTPPPPLYLDVNPQRKIVDGWVSQMINDGATVTENSEQGVLDYYRATKQTKNCIHIPFGPSPILATVTTKKVKKGQELFTTYGGTYWLGVWLDVHGEEGVGITNAMQSEIQETARDLVQSMKNVKVVYAQQLQVLQEAFEAMPEP